MTENYGNGPACGVHFVRKNSMVGTPRAVELERGGSVYVRNYTCA
jgi:hypothetical protein